ncbi:uncharacterized protein LOC122368996 [Amphibalanus amphitrite]|uniref:uncharacterized protein LOC122368996 n=1 Tax=Amphibalanus amphitrite TaxID=1232801 RepID=UPI001C910FBD|nr:uncharacterized protein LOC122368996 [Amphibalanus amphitrite]
MSSYKPAPPPPSRVHTATTEAPFQAAPTRRTESGEPRRPFRQPARSVVVARWGDDVQLDCRVESSNLIVTWFKNGDTFIAIENRTFIDDSRIEAHVSEDGLNWALRIRRVMMDDAALYTCHMALAPDDVIEVELDVIPAIGDCGELPPARVSSILGDILLPDFETTADMCPDESEIRSC